MIILYITKIFNENFSIYFKKNLTVIKENKNDNIIVTNIIKFISIEWLIISFSSKKLAPASAGIDNKKEILLASTLLNLRNLAAVIVMPALLTPGIKASIWNKPINNIDLTFKFVEIFFSIFLWSAK